VRERDARVTVRTCTTCGATHRGDRARYKVPPREGEVDLDSYLRQGVVEWCRTCWPPDRGDDGLYYIPDSPPRTNFLPRMTSATREPTGSPGAPRIAAAFLRDHVAAIFAAGESAGLSGREVLARYLWARLGRQAAPDTVRRYIKLARQKGYLPRVRRRGVNDQERDEDDRPGGVR
jgi:hypothetical protein